MSDVTDDAENDDNGDDFRGPWLLALGTLVIGGVAVTVETYRAIRNRRRDGPDDAE